MTREEAIEYWEQFNAEIDDLYDACSDADRDTLVKQREAVEFTISTLHAQQQPNAPLTLDELRQMDGEPVWVQSPGVPEYGRWAIVEWVGENCLFLHDDFTCHDYGKTWLAYRHKKEV